MKQTISVFVLSLALAVVSAAPAAAADKETRQMMADIRMLQEQAQQLETQVLGMTTALTEAIKSLDTRVSTRLDQQTDVTQKALADQKTVITTISNDVRNVREKLDDNTTRLGSLTLEVQALRQFVTASRSTTATPDPAPDNSTASGNSSPLAGGSPSTMGASPQAMYEHAYADYTASQFDLAIIGFEDFIKNFPTHPQADDAQVMICKSYSMDHNFEKSVEACDTAIRNYPKGTATPSAYYYKGTSLMDLKQADRARDAFSLLVKTFPDSQEATLAAERLDALKDPKKP